MFGHDTLDYSNIGSLVLGAEVKTFRASTEVSKDDSSNYYVIKPTGADYVTYYSKSGDQVGNNYGNSEMTMAEKVQSAISALPDGSTYIIEGFLSDEGVENSPTTGAIDSSNGDDDYSHSMYDCVTGTEYIADTEAEHDEYAALGYVHDLTECEKEEEGTKDTNWLLYGGIGIVVVVAGYFMKGKA